METGFQAGGSVSAFALILVTGGNAAFLAGELRPIRQQTSSIDAKPATVRREPSGANG
jgi:hypothetical protein